MNNKQQVIAYIGLGSNLNQPHYQIHAAIAALWQIPHTDLVIASHLYQTKPMGVTNQPDFINAVVALKTSLSAYELLSALQQIEHQAGRTRSENKNGPRCLDLDLLLYGDEVIVSSKLKVPHPRMRQRAFVLAPLVEIAPNLKLPDGKNAADHLLSLGDTRLLVTQLN